MKMNINNRALIKVMDRIVGPVADQINNRVGHKGNVFVQICRNDPLEIQIKNHVKKSVEDSI